MNSNTKLQRRSIDPMLNRITMKETVIIITLGLNLIATVGGFVSMRVALEHRLTFLETTIKMHMMLKDQPHDSMMYKIENKTAAQVM